MRVIVAGDDNCFRPHMVVWLIRAFQRLGCEVIHVASHYRNDGSSSYVDPVYVEPNHRFSSSPTTLSEVLSQVGHVDLCVMVFQCVNYWTIKNDRNDVPFAYIWREGNDWEKNFVFDCLGDGFCFVCMVGKGVEWPQKSEFMSFAADRLFLERGPSFENREYDLIYTGRERGTGCYERLRNMLIPLNMTHFLQGHIDGYESYGGMLRRSKATYAVDSGRYIMSRGLEAMASGCVVFWDEGNNPYGGDGFRRLNFIQSQDYLPTQVEEFGGDFFPSGDFISRLYTICRNRDEWTRISENSRNAILNGHTYEHRASRIAEIFGIQLPKKVEEC